MKVLLPEGWQPPIGYANGIESAGRLVFVAGQVGWDERQVFHSEDISQQFEQALRNVQPSVEVKPTRVGGATYQVPTEVPTHRGMTLAMRWVLENARARSGRNMAEKLAGELMDAASGQGASIKKKDDTHRMAEANRAFAHFR